MKLIRITLLLFVFFQFSSCLFIHKTETKTVIYKIDNSVPVDSSITREVLPYKMKVEKEMSKVIGFLENDLYKEQPVSNLGNWAADAISEWAKNKGQTIDFVVLNYGGLRLESIGKGPVLKGKIFELMPFDNSLVNVKMKGDEITELITHIINKGGWPVSKELNINFSKSSNETEVTISSHPVNKDQYYHILTLDYLANGGDNCIFFKGKNRLETGILLRSAMIEQLELQNEKGIKISAEKDNRIRIKP